MVSTKSCLFVCLPKYEGKLTWNTRRAGLVSWKSQNLCWLSLTIIIDSSRVGVGGGAPLASADPISDPFQVSWLKVQCVYLRHHVPLDTPFVNWQFTDGTNPGFLWTSSTSVRIRVMAPTFLLLKYGVSICISFLFCYLCRAFFTDFCKIQGPLQ